MTATPSPNPLEPAQLWILTVGSILNERNHDDHAVLGGSLRPRHAARATQILASGWDIRTRGEALDSLTWLFGAGHRTQFAAGGAGSPESFAAWDWCRAANVAGWSFVAYLVDRETAWDALLRAALHAQSTYTSFAEMGESYLRGMRLWAGSDDDERVRASEESFAQLCASPEGPYRLPWKTALEGAPPPAIAQKVEVVTPGQSIAEAILRVGSGGRVLLAAGHYRESVTPPHSVELAAQGDGEVVLEAQDRPAIVAKAEVREGQPRAISVSVRGITLRSGRSSEGKTLNATGAPGGYLRLHGCKVSASHNGASVREGGWLLLSRSVVEGCGQSGIWCDGGSVAVVDGELRDLAVHGAYVAKSPQSNVFETSTISRVGQIGLVAEAELRIRKCTIEAPARCGVVVHGPVWLSGSTIARSGGWGVAIENGGNLRLEKSAIEASQGANVDVKEGSLDAREATITGGFSSGLVVQANGRAFLADTRIEGHAQGNVYAVAGARLFAARSSIRGRALGLYLQDAVVAMVETQLESGEAAALDLRGSQVPVFYQCRLAGAVVLHAGTKARFAECTTDGEQTLGDGATVEEIDPAEASDTIDRVLAAVHGEDEPADGGAGGSTIH